MDDNFEMENFQDRLNRLRDQQEEQEEEETELDDRRKKSIMTIDTSNPNFKTESGKFFYSDTIPAVEKQYRTWKYTMNFPTP